MRESDAFSSMARNQLMGYFEKRRYNPISICGTMANYWEEDYPCHRLKMSDPESGLIFESFSMKVATPSSQAYMTGDTIMY